MWNWILLAVIVGGLAAFFIVVAVRQRHAGEKPMSDLYKDSHKTFPGGGAGHVGGA